MTVSQSSSCLPVMVQRPSLPLRRRSLSLVQKSKSTDNMLKVDGMNNDLGTTIAFINLLDIYTSEGSRCTDIVRT